ncbi:MAG: hypothetical protein H6744_18615 [Deltaproteobacteria bacterium]|nr:hypothetical protein [Deltaproteobacteria bacterium]MCB9788695.1 hypothetical protein [Deltaproteobacteria bacterium]
MSTIRFLRRVLVLRHFLACLGCGVLAGTLALGTARAATPHAEKSRTGAHLRLRLVDTSLESLPFGKGVDDVVGWVRARLETTYGPRLKAALSAHQRDVVRAQLEQELQDFAASLVEFDGSRTGFEVSVVANEFVPGAEESVLLFRESGVEHYFFFSHGKFWKYARPLPDDVAFNERLAMQTKDQGRPEAVMRSVDKTTVTQAVWQDKERRLRVQDARSLYRADLLVIEDRAIADRIDMIRGGRLPGNTGGEVDPDLDDFLDSGGATN